MKSQYPEAILAIKDWITNQKLQPGARLPSATKLSEQLGFGRRTTEIACNVLIARGVLHRTGYKLVMGTQTPHYSLIEGIVQVVSYSDSFIKTVGRLLTQRGIKYQVIELNFSKHKSPLPALRKVFAKKPAGVILWLPNWTHRLKSALESEKIPMVVCAEGIPPEVNLHGVGVDLYRGIEKGLKHLKDLGHRQIAYVTGFKPLTPYPEFYNCYRKICLQLDLTQTAATYWAMDSELEDEISSTLLQLHQRHPEVTALFIVGGHVANQALRTFQFPKELSLVNWKSTVSKDRTIITLRDGDDSVALSAYTNLIAQIDAINEGLPPRPSRHTFLMPDLIENGSTRALIE